MHFLRYASDRPTHFRAERFVGIPNVSGQAVRARNCLLEILFGETRAMRLGERKPIILHVIARDALNALNVVQPPASTLMRLHQKILLHSQCPQACSVVLCQPVQPVCDLRAVVQG